MAFLLDDDWDNDPRVVRAGTAAFGLYSRCGMWVARHLTDGFVPVEVATTYGTREWAAKLVDAGLWTTAVDGYHKDTRQAVDDTDHSVPCPTCHPNRGAA
jgi:hypothetical protein